MATLLLIVIYIAFIGLGIPDSLFGTAWPAIYLEFNLPISSANFVTLLISGGTIISSLFSAVIINKLGTAKVTAISTSITAVTLLGFSISNNIILLCIFAIPLGFGAGAIDTALNNYVALHYKANHMNFLHCFYGIGVSLSPYLMSLALSNQSNWRSGYKIAFFVQLGIALITIFSLPLWNKVHSTETPTEESSIPKTVGLLDLINTHLVKTVCLIFICSCGIEYICGVWGSTFLTNSKGMAIDNAAKIITFYYVGMTLGRFLSGVLSSKISSWRLIHIGQCIIFCAIILLIIPLNSIISGIALFMIGLGNGPIFPNLIHLTPKNFGKDISQSVMGIQMATSYIGIMLLPPVFGLLAQTISTNIFPYFILILFIIMIISTFLVIKSLKEQKKYPK